MLCLRVRVVYKVSCSPRRVKFLLGRKALEAGDAANKAFALGRNATLEGFNRAVADEAKTFAACLCWAKHATDRRKKRLVCLSEEEFAAEAGPDHHRALLWRGPGKRCPLRRGVLARHTATQIARFGGTQALGANTYQKWYVPGPKGGDP